MTNVSIPNFGELLAEHLGGVLSQPREASKGPLAGPRELHRVPDHAVRRRAVGSVDPPSAKITSLNRSRAENVPIAGSECRSDSAAFKVGMMTLS